MAIFNSFLYVYQRVPSGLVEVGYPMAWPQIQAPWFFPAVIRALHGVSISGYRWQLAWSGKLLGEVIQKRFCGFVVNKL